MGKIKPHKKLNPNIGLHSFGIVSQMLDAGQHFNNLGNLLMRFAN